MKACSCHGLLDGSGGFGISSFVLEGLFLPWLLDWSGGFGMSSFILELLDWSGGFGMSSFALEYALNNVRKRFLHVVTLKSTGHP